MVQKVVLFGSFGFGNTGDEAVPLAMSDMASHLGLSIEFHAVGRYSKVPMPNVIGLEEAVGAARSSLRGATVLLVGGGIIEARENATINHLSRLVTKIEPESVSLFSSNADFDRPYTWLQRRRLRKQLRIIQNYYMRDIRATRALNEFMSNNEAKLSGDILLWLQPDESSPPFARGSYISVCLAPVWTDQSEWFDWISRELSNLSTVSGLDLVFVPYSTYANDDRLIHDKVIEIIRHRAPHVRCSAIKEHMNPRAVLRTISGSKLVVGLRLHSCVMAYGQKVPFVGIGCHTKIFGFAETVNLQPCIVPGEAPLGRTFGDYGYRFDSERFLPNSLVDAALGALADSNFDALDSLREGLLSNFLRLVRSEPESQAGIRADLCSQ